MSEIDNLVLEQLRAIRGDIAEIKGDLHFLSQRVGALEQHVATLITMIPAYNDELDKLRKRVSRIEQRLELTD